MFGSMKMIEDNVLVVEVIVCMMLFFWMVEFLKLCSSVIEIIVVGIEVVKVRLVLRLKNMLVVVNIMVIIMLMIRLCMVNLVCGLVFGVFGWFMCGIFWMDKV